MLDVIVCKLCPDRDSLPLVPTVLRHLMAFEICVVSGKSKILVAELGQPFSSLVFTLNINCPLSCSFQTSVHTLKYG